MSSLRGRRSVSPSIRVDRTRPARGHLHRGEVGQWTPGAERSPPVRGRVARTLPRVPDRPGAPVRERGQPPGAPPLPQGAAPAFRRRAAPARGTTRLGRDAQPVRIAPQVLYGSQQFAPYGTRRCRRPAAGHTYVDGGPSGRGIADLAAEDKGVTWCQLTLGGDWALSRPLLSLRQKADRRPIHPYVPTVTHTPRRIIFHSQSAAEHNNTLAGRGLSTKWLCTSTVTKPPRGVYSLGAPSASWMTIGMRNA